MGRCSTLRLEECKPALQQAPTLRPTHRRGTWSKRGSTPHMRKQGTRSRRRNKGVTCRSTQAMFVLHLQTRSGLSDWTEFRSRLLILAREFPEPLWYLGSVPWDMVAQVGNSSAAATCPAPARATPLPHAARGCGANGRGEAAGDRGGLPGGGCTAHVLRTSQARARERDNRLAEGPEGPTPGGVRG